MTPFTKKNLLAFCSLLSLSAAFLVFAEASTVSHVSDGDTLVLEDGRRVRLIGVDTPEMHDERRNRQDARRNHLNEKTVGEFAQRAKGFVKSAVEGRPVRLEYDWQQKDKYGRTLAYVYRQPDDYFLNAEILKEGYGFAYLAFPFKKSEEFSRLAQQAQKEQRGLWKT